ncbi:hypothetical protein QBC45DRAFT_175991 [Copromyces sp. CBS 386.78]|nr:hypothetical protein QBC45DRAFT_175991 [Copromyces sp. CBS 386.78]
MCFGSKDKTDDTPGPRPAQHQQSPSQASAGKVNMPSPRQSLHQQQPQWQQQQPAYGNNNQNDYAPPSGPPPNSGHNQQHSGNNDYAPPSGPPPSWGHNQSSANDDFAPPPGPPPTHARPNQSYDDVAPPPGPPPSHQPPMSEEYGAPPPGPPPSHRQHQDDFAPPPGPPPSHHQHHQDDYVAPPPGPPPSHLQRQDDYTQPPPGPPPSQAKKQHDWESFVPDTALFPPPPAFFTGYDRSHTTNATEEEANAGEAWCAQNPLTAPMDLDPVALDALRTHNIRLMSSPQFRGKLDWVSAGVWKGRTEKAAGDACIISYPPLYCVKYDSPLIPSAPSRAKTIYYEVSIPRAGSNNPFLGAMGGGNNDDITLALGFTALPYPAFRMPGWHRGSLAVHGDDGHKYINDRWGGKDFTRPFRRGETYGIGMTFTNAGGKLDVNVFFTREGRITEQWDLHEEADSEQDLPVTGLEGFHDLSCAIGTFSAVEFEAVFEPGRWKFRPQGL